MSAPAVLVASTAIPAHALNATPVVRSLRAAGVRVLWSVPEFLAGHARRFVGADVRPFAGPASGGRVPPGQAERGRGGPLGALDAVRRLYRDDLVGSARARLDDLLALVAAEDVRLIVSDTLNLAAGIAAELTGVAWASLGDGPLQWPDPELPPFGTGLPVLGGPAGRHRNRHVKRTIDALLFADALADLNALRAERGLWPVADLLTAGVSRRLHLQGCVPGFEYPRTRLVDFVRYVGALGPGAGFAPPLPDELRRGVRTRPLGFVTQGTMRPDPGELVDPACRALLAEGYDVVVAGVRPTLAPDPRVRYLPAVDYADALAEADVLITNGGYTGVTLALAAGTPTVQCGATEEKPDIGARLRASGAGEALRLVRPPVPLLRRAVRRVTTDPARRAAQHRLATEFAAHDTDALLRAHLLPLVGTR